MLKVVESAEPRPMGAMQKARREITFQEAIEMAREQGYVLAPSEENQGVPSWLGWLILALITLVGCGALLIVARCM